MIEEDLSLLENQYEDQIGFIIASGPSLAFRDLSFLKKEISITVNMVPLMFDFWGIESQFHLVADKFVYPNFKEVLKELIYYINNKIIKIIIGNANKTYPMDLADKNTYFSKQVLDKEISFSRNPIRNGFCRGKTVAFDAIQLSFFLGFKEVYILGMDMTTNHKWGKNGHCYEIQINPRFPDVVFSDNDSIEIKRGLPGHPEYRPLIYEYLREAKKHFEEKNREIFIDSSSSLTIFNKVDIIDIFGK